MLLDKAQQIKAKLRFLEGRQMEVHTIWKIMICPRHYSPESLLAQCRDDFSYDDICSALNYRDDIDVYIVYRHGETFSMESHDQFAGHHTV